MPRIKRAVTWGLVVLAALAGSCKSREPASLDELVRSWPEADGGKLFAESARTWKVEQRRVTVDRVSAPSYVLFPGQKLEARADLKLGDQFTFWVAGLSASGREPAALGSELEVRFEGRAGPAEVKTIPVKTGAWSTVRLWAPSPGGNDGLTISLVCKDAGTDSPAHDRAVAIAAPRITRERAGRPNIILISIDTLRPDHLGCYGYVRETSPAIDRLARESVRFDNAYSHSSWTPPSVASLFTSLYPPQHGSIGKDRVVLGEANRTLAEALSEAGYRTLAFSASPFIAPDFGFGQGFMLFGMDDTERAENLNALALPFLEPDETEPLFLYLMYFDPHFPYEPPDAYANKFQAGLDGRKLWDPARITRVTSLFDLGAALDRQTFEFLKSSYDSEISSVDEQLGTLLHTLETWFLHQNSWIILTADHGEEFLEHGDYGHGNTLYREVLRVPLIIRPPGPAGPGRVIKETVRQIDLMPTILELAGEKRCDRPELLVSKPRCPEMMGESLAPMLTSQAGPFPDRPVFASIRHLFHEGEIMRSYQTGALKLIITENPNRAELFNLDRDPDEQANLAPHETAILEDMTLKLLDYESRLKPFASFPNLIPQPLRTRQILESLGYVGP